MPKSLEGIRVLDLSRVLAGPWATQLLADFGADVIKIERPLIGDDARHWGPPFMGDAKVQSAYFLCANRGKRSITLDFTKKRGQELLRALVETADVVVENYKVGGLAAYGLDYPSLHAINDKLIYCSITGYGQDGPYADRPGYDFILQGAGGLMSVTGKPDDVPGGGPAKVGVAVVDIMTGLYASNAILAALHHRTETGLGQHIDVALLDVQVAMLANQALSFLVTGKSPTRQGEMHPSIMPYQTFDASDRKINIAVGNDAQFSALCAALDMPQVATDPRFKTNDARVVHRDLLAPMLQFELRKRLSEPLIKELNAAGVPAGPINTVGEVFEDPQVRHRRIARKMNHPKLGEIPTVACPVNFSDTPVTYDLAPPVLGEHTSNVLHDLLGLTELDIKALAEERVI